MNINYLASLRKFALDAVTDGRHAPEAVRRELEAKWRRADREYAAAFWAAINRRQHEHS